MQLRPPPRARGPAAGSAALLALCALALGACGNTLQDEPVAPSFLEPLVMQEEFPVYWLGGAFRRLPIINVGRDSSGAYEIQYGNCTQGGENVCVTPLQIVTSPDNSFRPGGSTPQRPVTVRGAPGTVAQSGRTIELSTGGVVVDIYAASPALARAAAEDDRRDRRHPAARRPAAARAAEHRLRGKAAAVPAAAARAGRAEPLSRVAGARRSSCA